MLKPFKTESLTALNSFRIANVHPFDIENPHTTEAIEYYYYYIWLLKLISESTGWGAAHGRKEEGQRTRNIAVYAIQVMGGFLQIASGNCWTSTSSFHTTLVLETVLIGFSMFSPLLHIQATLSGQWP